MRMIGGAFLLAAIIAPASLEAATHNPAHMVAGKTTVAETMQQYGAPTNTVMNPDGALTLFYPGSRLGQSGTRVLALHFGTDFIFRDAKVSGRTIVTVQDVASR